LDQAVKTCDTMRGGDGVNSGAWDRAEIRDLAVAARQLGRPLAGRVVAVAKRCSYVQPQVLVTYPLLQVTEYGVAEQNAAEQNAAEHSGDTGPCCEPDHGVPPRWAPFPTVFWLTCPHVRSAVATLESQGMIEDVRRRIREDAEFRREYECANARYASQRIGLLDVADRARLHIEAQKDGPGAGVLRVIEKSGIGGVADWTGVKCLHMNVADFMAGNANPVGELCVQRLTEDGAGPGLECAGGRCVLARGSLAP